MRELGERRTLIGFLPEATQLRGPARRLHLLSMGRRAPTICLYLPIPPALLQLRHLDKLRKVTAENRPLGPERQVVYTSEHVLPATGGGRKKRRALSDPPSRRSSSSRPGVENLPAPNGAIEPRKPKRQAPCPAVPSLIQLQPFLAVLKPPPSPILDSDTFRNPLAVEFTAVPDR